ncbi:MAG TPA: FecR family protein [Kofleriaceae bacterium]|nr:FecR family protein [Kofleriaceae bacterium]
MSAHVAPHRWADLWAGRVEEAERVEMERHAKRCRACQRVRQRVTRASDSFVAIRTQSVPEVSWDAIRAKVHWSVSTERRAALRGRRPAYVWLAAALAAGLALGAVTGDVREPAPVAQPLVRRETHAAPPLPQATELVGLVSRASGDVMVDGVRPGDLFARPLGKGSRIATADGRVDIQFGDRSAFALGARSTIELRRFDSQVIELAVDGTVDISVAARGEGQRFLVHAGDQTVEVRGTQFRVTHDGGATSVACRHGLVAVSDDTARVEVGAARRIHVAKGSPVSSQHVVALSSEETAALAQATPLTLPMWDPATLVQSSAPLEVATSGRRDVRVDGVELGLAPLRVRVMPGRHTVEAADGAGRFRRAGWIDVTATPRGARIDVPAEPPPTNGITERKRQLRGGIDRLRLGRCTRSIAKAGLTDTYVKIEIAVDAQGAVGALNVIDTDLPSATSSCVHDVLADVRFPRGAAATWIERIDL